MENKHKRLSQITPVLSEVYTHVQLKNCLQPYTTLFVKKNYAFLKKKGIEDDFLDLIRLKTLNKALLAQFCSIPFFDKACFLLFKASLPADVQVLFDELFWRDPMHQKEIESQLGIQVSLTTENKTKYHTYIQKELKAEFYFFQVVEDYTWSYQSGRSFILFIHPIMKEMLLPFIDLPAAADLVPLDKVETGLLRYEQGDQFILSELPRIYLFLNQGLLKFTVSGRPVLSSLNGMQKKLKLAEFYPEENNKWLKTLRTNLVAGLVGTSEKNIMAVDSLKMLQALFPKIYIEEFYVFHTLFNFLKGVDKIETYHLNDRGEYDQWKLLNNLLPDKWYAIDNIIEHAKYHLITTKVVRPYEAEQYLYNEYEADTDYGYPYKQKFYITKDKYRQFIEIPLLKGSFFLFAAMGLVDIAYQKPNAEVMGQTCDSPYDGLRFVRLSKLGAFLTGKATTYSPPEAIQQQTLKLSPAALLIIADGNPDHNAILLEPFAEKVDDRHYKVTYEHFFVNCQTKKELQTKIQQFKQHFPMELPPNWEAFFKELEQKLDPLEKPQELYVFKISPDNTGLIQLLARDPQLRQMTLKAENYHILIPKDQWAAFKKRLRSFGYLLTK